MYYNQNDYPHVPYPAPGYESATVKSGGCGVCCGATVLSFFGEDFEPEDMAYIFIKRGARVPGGTDMRIACNIVAELAGATVTTSSSEAELTACLQRGGIAIANVDGDAGEKGVFSTAGHYICIVGLRENGDFLIFDVGDYPSKYTSSYRATLIKREGELLRCSRETLDMDTRHRVPNYYLFTKSEEDTELTYEQFKKFMLQYEAEKKALDVSTWASEAWDWAKSLKILDGTMPQSPLTREQAALVIFRMLGGLRGEQ